MDLDTRWFPQAPREAMLQQRGDARQKSHSAFRFLSLGSAHVLRAIAQCVAAPDDLCCLEHECPAHGSQAKEQAEYCPSPGR